MGDNGGLEKKEEPIKSEEQELKERLERYQKDPYKFVEMSDIVICCIRNPESGLGISVFIGDCKRSELDIAKSELEHIVHKRMISMDVQSEMKQQAAKHIFTPGSMLNFARRKR